MSSVFLGELTTSGCVGGGGGQDSNVSCKKFGRKT